MFTNNSIYKIYKILYIRYLNSFFLFTALILNYYHTKVRKLGQNCAKGVGPSQNLRFKQLKENCLKII